MLLIQIFKKYFFNQKRKLFLKYFLQPFQIIRTTGFFDGLFSEEELVSDNVKDRDSKIAFLQKIIEVVSKYTTN